MRALLFMYRSLTVFLPLSISDLEKNLEAFQVDFDALLEDSFSDDELQRHEGKLDGIAAISAQPLSGELSYSDLTPDPETELLQEAFFRSCRSFLILENVPYLETNPFQVTYLLELLKLFPEALIDRGDHFCLQFKNAFLLEVTKFSGIDALLPIVIERKLDVLTKRPVDPIDFLILDVYRELERLKGKVIATDELPEKLRKIAKVMNEERGDASFLLRKSGLTAKDFDDGLERLKFWLRKI